MSNIATQQTVQTIEVNGRKFEIERTTWNDSEGLSFDVTDTVTGQLLTVESFDTYPDASDISNLLEHLREDLIEGSTDSFFEDEESLANLRQILSSSSQ